LQQSGGVLLRIDLRVFMELVSQAAWLRARFPVPAHTRYPRCEQSALESLRRCARACGLTGQALDMPSVSDSADQLLDTLESLADRYDTTFHPDPHQGEPLQPVVLLTTSELIELCDRTDHLAEQVSQTLDDRMLLQVRPRAEHLFDCSEPPFGLQVFVALPWASEDIDEAGRCLALECPTATMFHLGRAMDHAMRVVTEELRAPTDERRWNPLIAHIEHAVKAMPLGPWSGAVTHLYRVKQAWRNDVLQPSHRYTLEQAEDAYAAVRVFLRHVSLLL
jgi:hypothetical protein